MVQLFLGPRFAATRRTWLTAAVLFLAAFPPLSLAASKNTAQTPVTVPQLELSGGRKLVFTGTFRFDRDVQPKPGFWTKLANLIAGEGPSYGLILPYGVVTDSRDRIIVTDPGASGIHIFDFKQHKYKFVSRIKEKDGLQTPQCLAVDAADNIYVTDSESGKIFVFDADGKYKRMIGSLPGGEGYYKRPTGIAVDSQAQRIYVTDTLRNQIFMLDLQGNVLQTFGKTGTGEGEFNYPTELRLNGETLAVVDAMNFRVQVLDRAGNFKYAIGQIGDGVGAMFRPKGIGFDSEGHLYVAEGLSGMVQVFDDQGQLLYYFGRKGSGLGEFQLPAGLFIDHKDQVLVVDSYNQRVQAFQYTAAGKPVESGKP